MKKGHRFLWSAIVLPIALLASCSAGGGKTATKDSSGSGTASVSRAVITVQTVPVRFGPLVTHHSAAGTVTPVTESKVASQVAGVVLRVTHRAGTWVQQGATVVQLDDSRLKLAVQSAQAAVASAKANVEKAKAQLDLAELTLHRDERLLQSGSLPRSRVDNDKTTAETAKVAYLAAQAAVKQAQAQLDQADLNLHYASVRAPFAGQLAAVNVEEGEFVMQSAPVFVIVSASREISFDVPPADASVLSVGAGVSFTAGGRSYTAHVSQAPSAPINGVVPMVALLSSSDTLPYGIVGKVSYRLTLGRGAIIPISALQTNGNQDFVYIVSSAHAAMQKVEVTAESATDAVVSGLAAGMQLIINPPPGLLVGSPVTPAESQHG